MRFRMLVAVLLIGSVTACGTTSDSTLETGAVTTATSSTTPPDVSTTEKSAPSDTADRTPSTSSTTVRPQTTPGTTPLAAEPADVEPPLLLVTSPTDGAVADRTTLRFEGRTEPGAVVTAWDRWTADVDADGNWSISLILEPGANLARFRATDEAGNSTEVSVGVHCRLAFSQVIIGHWTGDVTVPDLWSPIEDFWIEFRSDGSYSAGSTGTPAFYYGTNDDHPEKVYSVNGIYPDGPPGSGTIAIVWADDGTVYTIRQGSLENITFSQLGDRLEFDFWNTWKGRYGPVHYDLIRTDPPT